MKKQIPIMELTEENFKLFGKIVDIPSADAQVDEENLSYWHQLYSEEFENGLVLGFLKIRKQLMVVRCLEKHINNCEIFIPLSGTALMPFAPALNESEPDLDKMVAFRIEPARPILVNKGVWHMPALPLGERVDFFMNLPAGILSDIHKANIEECEFEGI